MLINFVDQANAANHYTMPPQVLLPFTVSTGRYYQYSCVSIQTVPDDAIACSCADNTLGEWNNGIDRHWMAREPVADVAIFTPVENIKYAFFCSADNLCAILKTGH